MGRIYADADPASYRTRERRRRADIEFLERLRTATIDQLYELEANHAHKKAPAWKKVAIARAIARAKEPSTGGSAPPAARARPVAL